MSIFRPKDNSETEAALERFLANGGEIKRLREATRGDVEKSYRAAKKRDKSSENEEEKKEDNPLRISIFSREEKWSK